MAENRAEYGHNQDHGPNSYHVVASHIINLRTIVYIVKIRLKGAYLKGLNVTCLLFTIYSHTRRRDKKPFITNASQVAMKNGAGRLYL